MSNFLSTGISGLLAFQRALDTTSQNIANVATPGYSRQRTEFVTRTPSPYGNGWVGNGVQVSTVARVYDDLLAEQVRDTTSTFSNLDTYTTQINKINNLFSSSSTGVSATMQKFANALQDLANTPTSSSAHTALLNQAQGLAQRLKSYDTELAGYDKQIESSLSGEASTVTSLSHSIAQLNDQISAASARFGQPPNDLLDQRDKLIDDLSSHIDITTATQPDGSVNVYVGNGQPLVVGNKGADIITTPDAFDPTRHGLALKAQSGTPVDITTQISGGSLGGMLSFRTQVLDPTRNSLGRISVALTTAINDQHHAGVDLSGNPGGDLFSIGGVNVAPDSTNTGNATLNVTRSNVAALTEADYVLEKTATGWSLTRTDTHAPVTFTGTGVPANPVAGTPADPIVADGLTIDVSNGAQTGDRFLIRPTRNATAGLNVLVTDPSQIAAASPIRTAANSANTGTATIDAGTVVNATNPALTTTANIVFVDPTHYTINGGAQQVYTTGNAITANGWQVTISGSPKAGDAFTVSQNTNGSGDNRNALALAASLANGLLDNGTTSVNDATSRIVGSVGAQTQQVQSSRDAQEVIQKDAVSARDAVSGVNLDEEAANLIKYQQAYQAAAQIISAANTMFNSLLAATGR